MSRPQIILVMGVTGVGKSTFIQHATRENVEVGHGQNSCTMKPRCYQITGTNTYLMDTPGFDDTFYSDAQVLAEIASALLAFHGKMRIQGVLYIHSVLEARMRGSGLKNLRMFREVLGVKEMVSCRLVTTKWSLQDPSVSLARVEELCEKREFWQPLLAAGASTVRFGDTRQSAMEIIMPLVQGDACVPQLITEMVTEHKSLSHTQAGQTVSDNIDEAQKGIEAEINVLRAEEKRNSNKKDQECADELREEMEGLEETLRKLRRTRPCFCGPSKALEDLMTGSYLSVPLSLAV